MTKSKKIRKHRGGVKGFKVTPITDKKELQKLEEADKIAKKRDRNDNEMKRINAELEKQRINTITSFASTPMDPKELERQNQEDKLHSKRVNSKKAKSKRLMLSDLGGSIRRKYKKSKKRRKYKKHKKTRGGNRIGGNNIGANCNDPNFSIYNTNLLKLFPYKGGSEIPPERNMKLLQSPEAEEIQRLEEEERQRLIEEQYEDDRIRQNDEDDRIRQNDEYDRIRENNQDEFIRGIRGDYVNNDNSDEPEMERLSLSDLGGSNQKNNRKGKKTRKNKKRRTKGGELQADDIYKNSEGSNF